MSLGPFDISADRIVALGVQFTPFINRLLDLECRANALSGHQLVVNVNETTPDGGVDASVRGMAIAGWVPAGDSAWQFKRSNFGPKACRDEFKEASWAHEFVRGGGSYIMAIAAALPDNLIEKRRRAIAQEAIDQGLLSRDDRDRIRVYDANLLGRWASRFPALAVSRLAGGPGHDAIDFDTWSAGRTHTVEWTPDEARSAAVAAIREQVASDGVVEIRVQGDSGIGKTRLVLEALRDPSLRPLVAYVADERSIGGELLAHLVSDGRSAVLIVDECPAERHVKLAERLPDDPSIKLVTIGDTGPAVSRGPVIGLPPISAATTEAFLKGNYPALSPEQRRFVADHSQGNVRWTMVLADRVERLGGGQAADLISRNDIAQFVAELVPEGSDFFCATLLALFERLGWEGKLRYQLDLLASFAGVSTHELESTATRLEERGLLNKVGRYRAITPHPLAVFLAAEGWRHLGDRLIDELLPLLDEETGLAFFRRVADLGRFEPARSVLPRLLDTDGPFGTLEKLEAAKSAGRMLTQLAIVVPDQVAMHLYELVEDAEIAVLANHRKARRDLVWTLEKLAWHSATFEIAADTLLRLAQAENETFANNATGTWLDLFGAMLPATAASPAARIAYLKRRAASPASAVRMLCVKATSRAFQRDETITVSGEVQGGVLVEPRGAAKTWEELGDYRNEMIRLLSGLTGDPDDLVSAAAEDEMIAAVHPLVGDGFSNEALSRALVELGTNGQRKLRISLEHLRAIYARSDREEEHVPRELQRLLERLPASSPADDLCVVGHLHRWDFDGQDLQFRVTDLLNQLSHGEVLTIVEGLLEEADLPAAWEIGFGLASIESASSAEMLVRHFDANPNALFGYLVRLEESNERAFEDFLESDLAFRLDKGNRLAIAVRGKLTGSLREFILSGLRDMPIEAAVTLCLAWHRHLDGVSVRLLLEDWLTRLESQGAYNALIDWVSLVIRANIAVVDASISELTWTLIALRRLYPDVGRESWDWSQLALLFVQERPFEIGMLILDLVDQRQTMIHQNDELAQILVRCTTADPRIWEEVARRLEGGSWLLQMELRGWFLYNVPPDAVYAWVAEDLQRARLVASIAPLGDASPSAYATFLLDRFGTDDQVRSSLYGSLVSGFWTGNESDRIGRQIAQLDGWRSDPTQPRGVRSWARDVVKGLEQARAEALQREAEERY